MGMYGRDSLLNCNDLCQYVQSDPSTHHCYQNEQVVSQILTTFPIDDVLILSLGLVGLISSIFVIYTFIKFKETRKQPGDIILAISISEFILLCHWMSMVIHNLYYNIAPETSSPFCQTEAFFSITAGTSEFVYNCLFCIYIILQVKNTLLQKTIPKKWFHLGAALIITGVILYCELSGSTGLSLFGMCSFKQQQNFSTFGVLLVVVYLILSSITIYYFRSKVPDNQIFSKYRKEFLGYYTTYVVMQTAIWSVLAIANLLVGLNCNIIQDPGLNFFVTVGNTCKLLTSICLSIVRYKDPNIRKVLRPILENKLPCLFKKTAQSMNSQNEPLISGDSQSENPSDIRIKAGTGNFFDELYKKLRISEIYTMIAGVVALQKLSPQNPTLSLAEITEQDCKEKFTTNITQEKIQQFPSIILHDSKKKYDSLIDDGTKVTMYAPKLFKTFIEIDRKMVNLDVSFNINENIRDISLQFGGTDGGRGGAFFYLTNDIKMMMKSMNKEELDVLLKNLFKYKEHFLNNPNSLISKIYGLFTFKKGDKTEHILLMRNIQSCPKQFKLRTYDLKGSTVDRSVLKKITNPIKRSEAIQKKTLKDEDFTQVEKDGKVHIDPQTAQIVSQILTEDAKFFNLIEVMDYSLLIIKINWSQFSIEAGESEEYMQNYLFNNSLYSIPSIYEPGVRYHMAIIDYLQVWNLKKQGEQQAKKLKQIDINLDVSAQEPSVYSQRFIKNIAQKLFI